MRLEYMMTRDVQEAKEKNLPVIIPIGTIEWHGPHCALGCDTLLNKKRLLLRLRFGTA